MTVHGVLIMSLGNHGHGHSLWAWIVTVGTLIEGLGAHQQVGRDEWNVFGAE